jgi:hypothetical protein
MSNGHGDNSSIVKEELIEAIAYLKAKVNH